MSKHFGIANLIHRGTPAKKVKTPADGGVGAMFQLLDDWIDKLPGGRSSVRALGVAVPGPVDGEGRALSPG